MTFDDFNEWDQAMLANNGELTINFNGPLDGSKMKIETTRKLLGFIMVFDDGKNVVSEVQAVESFAPFFIEHLMKVAFNLAQDVDPDSKQD